MGLSQLTIHENIRLKYIPSGAGVDVEQDLATFRHISHNNASNTRLCSLSIAMDAQNGSILEPYYLRVTYFYLLESRVVFIINDSRPIIK